MKAFEAAASRVLLLKEQAVAHRCALEAEPLEAAAAEVAYKPAVSALHLLRFSTFSPRHLLASVRFWLVVLIHQPRLGDPYPLSVDLLMQSSSPSMNSKTGTRLKSNLMKLPDSDY